MSATTDPLSEIPGTEEDLGCYSGLFSTRARVLVPEDLEQLRQIFAHARRVGRRIAIRAGAHSFDGQSLGDELVVSMKRFDSIEVLADQRKVRVGSGATWGAILAELEPLGLVPAVTVTTADATAGGTLSGDCLSRFSPAYGKEGEWIESFDLLTAEGELLHCTAPAKGVRTTVRKFETFAGLATDLVPKTEGMVRQASDPRNPALLDSIWWALDTRGDGSQSALLFTSTFTTTNERRRMPRIARSSCCESSSSG
jgi:FAD binding domain